MNSITPALAFEGTTFDVVQRKGQIWLRAAEIAQALGYSRADKVTQIFDRNRDEFTPTMTQTLKLRVSGLQREIRLFSLRGAHLIAMFARTPAAKAFRRWVLDVLDREVVGARAEAAMHKPIDPLTLESIDGICRHADAICAWWRKFGGAVETLNPRLYHALNDHMMFARTDAGHIQQAMGFMSIREYMESYPWLGSFSDREAYRRHYTAGKGLCV